LFYREETEKLPSAGLTCRFAGSDCALLCLCFVACPLTFTGPRCAREWWQRYRARLAIAVSGGALGGIPRPNAIKKSFLANPGWCPPDRLPFVM
jgi:hypothetical protein